LSFRPARLEAGDDVSSFDREVDVAQNLDLL
jgi:hypothetical protein